MRSKLTKLETIGHKVINEVITYETEIYILDVHGMHHSVLFCNSFWTEIKFRNCRLIATELSTGEFFGRKRMSGKKKRYEAYN